MSYSIIEGQEHKFNSKSEYKAFTQKEWDNYPFAGEEKLKWFRDAKCGFFLSVGISSIGKVDIGWPRHTHKAPDPWPGGVPDEVYDGWAKQLKFEEFNANEWIDLAIQGGFKYVVIIVKHHDGFHMWDTAYSEHKITNSPFGRDYLRELVDACHERELPIGLYYSQRDWYHPDYAPIEPSIINQIEQAPFFEYKDGEGYKPGKTHYKYIEYMRNTVLEIMSKYGKIDMLWWDACWCGGMFFEEMWNADALEREVRKLQPHIIINNRAGVPGDFDTPEGRVGFLQRHRAWETCMPLGRAWAYTGENAMPLKKLMHKLLFSVCGDGNYLLSIGCMPSGKIGELDVLRIKEMGNWLSKYGDSVYGTRSGPWNPGSYGGSVFKDNKVYLHILNIPYDGKLELPAIKEEIKGIKVLTGEAIQVEVTKESVSISGMIPTKNHIDTIVEFEMLSNVAFNLEGIEVVAAGNQFDKQPTVYGGVVYSNYSPLSSSQSIIDVNDSDKITAIFLTGEDQEVTIQCSLDNMEWENVYEGRIENGICKVEVLSYIAGAYICGKEANYVRIKTEGTVASVLVYGIN